MPDGGCILLLVLQILFKTEMLIFATTQAICMRQIYFTAAYVDGILSFLARYVLNTSVDCPHIDLVCSLKFRPEPVNDPAPMAVTTSLDGKFKLWKLVDDTDIYSKFSSTGIKVHVSLKLFQAYFSPNIIFMLIT